MFTTSILARKAHVPVFTVRHYTRIGLLNPSRRESNGYKIYKDSDIKLLRFITNAKALGFTLKEIAEIMDKSDHGKSPCPIVREIIDKRIKENRQKMKQMQKLQKQMEKAQSDWEKMEDAMPNGHSVCHLIESFAD